MRLNYVVAILGLIFACCVVFVLHGFGYPDRITFGAGILSILFVAIIWSTVNLTMGADDED